MEMIESSPQKWLYQLSAQIAKRYVMIKKDFPNWGDIDSRITVYGRNSNLIENVLFSMIFKNEQLRDKNWYKKIPYIVTPNSTQLNTICNNYELNLRVWLVTGYLASVETFLRLLMKKINPKLAEKELYLICEYTLKRYNLKLYQLNFDFYRIIRNSLHNNGIITDKFAKPIMFDGIIYQIEKGKPIKVNWLMLCKLTSELDICLDKIIRSDEVSKLDDLKDLSYF